MLAGRWARQMGGHSSPHRQPPPELPSMVYPLLTGILCWPYCLTPASAEFCRRHLDTRASVPTSPLCRCGPPPLAFKASAHLPSSLTSPPPVTSHQGRSCDNSGTGGQEVSSQIHLVDSAGPGLLSARLNSPIELQGAATERGAAPGNLAAFRLRPWLSAERQGPAAQALGVAPLLRAVATQVEALSRLPSPPPPPPRERSSTHAPAPPSSSPPPPNNRSWRHGGPRAQSGTHGRLFCEGGGVEGGGGCSADLPLEAAAL